MIDDLCSEQRSTALYNSDSTVLIIQCRSYNSGHTMSIVKFSSDSSECTILPSKDYNSKGRVASW